MEKYIDPETNRFKLTVPKLKPKWLTVLMELLNQRDPNFPHTRAIELIDQEWKSFHERGKERAPRKPKEKPAEPTSTPEEAEEQLIQQQSMDVTMMSRFLRREFPAMDKDQWKVSRHTRPRTRLLQNVSSIDKVFRKCKLFPRSQPYRALHEIRKTLEELIDNIPQTEDIVKSKIVDGVDANEASFDYDQLMGTNEDDMIVNDPPPPTPKISETRDDAENNCTTLVVATSSPIRYGYS